MPRSANVQAMPLHAQRSASAAARTPFSVAHDESKQQQQQPQAPSKPRSASTPSRRHRHASMSPLGLSWLGPSSPASTRSSSPRSSTTIASVVDDEILTNLAQSALDVVKTAARSSAFECGVWKEVRASTTECAYEQRTPSAFRLITKSLLPCTADEVARVFASDDADQFNASMLELFGTQFAFSVPLRTVPTSEPGTHLSLKAVAFASSKPLVATTRKRATRVFDYVERDCEQRTISRVVQTLRCASDLDGNSNSSDRQHVLGDVLIGYVLQEDVTTQRTMVFLYAAYTPRMGHTVRCDVVQRLRRVARVHTKWLAIATRRRFGTHTILDRAQDVAQHAMPHSCAVCAQSIGRTALRTKHFCCLCGHFVCSSCSGTEDIEERIGLVDRLRVCSPCSTRVLTQAFAHDAMRWQSHNEHCGNADEPEQLAIVREGRAAELSWDRDTDSSASDDRDSERPRYRQYMIV